MILAMSDHLPASVEPTAASLVMRRASETANLAGLVPRLDDIFFEASATRSFADAAARAEFRWRWLGRYLERDPRLVHFAFLRLGRDGADTLAGYLAGDLDDPARSGRYGDIGYFPLLGEWTARFPAHLHVNVAREARSLGLGSQLVERFVADVAGAGRSGVHVVTGAASRNVAFYRRNGFTAAHEFDWQGTRLVLLGRST